VTDQRNRVTTDPGLGPVGLEHPTTLRSIAAAEPIAEDEDTGAPVYYEPKPLNAVSDHKTLELETVKLSKDIDPRKLPTELKLRRPVLHVMPASDPNWPAPDAPAETGWNPPLFDSGWPPPETVLTTSQPPLAAKRRSFIPLVLLAMLGAAVLLVLGATARRRSAASASTAQRAPAAASPNRVEALLNAVPPLPSSESAPLPSSESAPLPSSESAPLPSSESAPLPSSESAPPAESAASASASATAAESVAEPNASAAAARLAEPPHHTNFKPTPPPIASSRTLSAPPTAKPKRAIY
jgi:hypothetical protein